MLLRWMLVVCCLMPSALAAQEAPQLLRVHGDLNEEVLVNVKAADLRNGGIAVLTDPTPAVHLFLAEGYESWGREGGGPAELSSPVDVTWPGGSILVLDVGHRKIVKYGEDGSFIEMRSVGDWANRMFVIDGDTILGMFRPTDRGRGIVRVADQVRDTVISYSMSPNQVRLEAPGAPSFTVSDPFTSQPRWTVLRDGTIAMWRPETESIHLIDLQGIERGQVDVIGPSLPIEVEDRESWFRDAIPEEFMGQRVFEPIRRRAREVMTFPNAFPPVMGLQGDPSGGIWILKNAAATGEVWYVMNREGQELGSLRLPPGRRLLRVGTDELVVWGEDEIGIERVEVYRHPGWADS